MDEFAQLVKDKQVLLVGNGNSLIEKDNSKLIDSYEFVIRFNLSINKDHRYIGKKIDGWFYTMVSEEKCKRFYNSAKIRPKHCIRHHSSPLDIGEKNYFINTNIYRKKINQLLNIEEGYHPSSGLCCINYLMEYCDTKSVSIIGFDSFSTKNFYESSHRLSGIKTRHKPDIEKDYLSKLSNENQIQIID